MAIPESESTSARATQLDQAGLYQYRGVAHAIARDKKLIKRDRKALRKAEKARVTASEKINTALEYLDNTAFNGVAQLNRLLQVSIFKDFWPL